MQEILYLSRNDVAGLNLSMGEIISALEEMFIEKGKGRVEMPPKPGIHTRTDSFIHAMPAYIPKLESAGIKWVSGYPGNMAKKLPYISGLLILNDVETGIPLSVMDCTWITAQRTGAATAVAAKHLARRESKSLGILACGVQGRSNLEALAEVFKFEKVKAYDMNFETAKTYSKEMSKRFSVEVEAVKSPEEAVINQDIIVTSGPILKKPKPIIPAEWLSKGSFSCPLDFDSYFQPSAFHAMNKFATDDSRQFFFYRHEGYFLQTPDPYADLGDLATGAKKGRETPEEKTMAVNLGLALEDMATAIRVYRRALELGAGTRLEL